jgi:hypothetical protein
MFKNIDLISVNCTDPTAALCALKYCQKYFKFNKTLLISHENITDTTIDTHTISKLNSLNEYNDFILHLNDYVESDHVLLIQDDGHIVNPDLWTDEFLQYDYIGAPWPSEDSWISQQYLPQQEYIRKYFPLNRVGNGGFSLRSKKFLKFANQYLSCDGLGEDTFLCTRVYNEAIEYGIKFAPFELATQFSYENPCTEHGYSWQSRIVFDKTKHFGWHGKNFINTSELMNLKYT